MRIPSFAPARAFLPSSASDRLFERTTAGCVAFQQDDDQQARAYLADVPGLPVLMQRWGEQQETKGKLELAARLLSLAAALDTERGEIHYAYAMFMIRHGAEPARTLGELNTATALSPERWWYHAALGEQLLQVGNSQEAVGAYSKALDLSEEKAALYIDRAKARLGSGQDEAACEDLAAAFELGGPTKNTAGELLCRLCPGNAGCPATVQ